MEAIEAADNSYSSNFKKNAEAAEEAVRAEYGKAKNLL